MAKNRSPKEVDHQADDSDAKALVKNVVVNDLIGRDEWKQSKLGYLSGASVIRRSLGTVSNTASDSMNRLSTLATSVFSRENVQSLPDGGSPHERFIASMQIHGKSEGDIELIQRNTYLSSLLYGALMIVSIVLGVSSLFLYSPRDIVDVATRFVPLFIVGPMTFKHLYTNWVVRTRQIAGVAFFIRSKDWLPSKK